ncbi:hypothetical protein CERZMDRAFT_93769 [Cercospora zeae-maydis SCOH1-5]|uniref:AA1-like domain-containing protein n=1 Tax=Cercospora zeae-maydis SCOH1-5 TaxID=717836 RepID=A0A6A6FSX4_9PEZI|nr:hypothetical protein CERZMDRAFT_93769 [Cercospora zeae-maydis SCOH1-5]
MHFSTLLAAGAASLVAAAPAPQGQPAPSTLLVGTFKVSQFNYTCEAGNANNCQWSFNLGIWGEGENHPAAPGPYFCEGSSANSFFKACNRINDTQTLLAYIPPSNMLQFQYDVDVESDMTTYAYFAQALVRPNDAAQPQNFQVPETAVKQYAMSDSC